MKDDTIKRADAIKALCDITNNSDMQEDWHRGISVSISALYRVPSADDWIPLNTELIASKYDVLGIHRGGFEPDTFMVVRKGADDD